MEHLHLHDAVVFLVAAGLVIPFAKRLRISPVLGFLLIGLVVGPYGMVRFAEQLPWIKQLAIADVSGVTALAELGVVFLLFMIGLELSINRLWQMRNLVFGLGSAQIIISAIAIGAIAMAFGNSSEAAVILGSCLALSSTAIVMQLLKEQGRFGTSVGHGSFSILLAQDIAVVPILFMVGAFGAHSDGSLISSIGLAFGQAFIAVLFILGVGRLVVRPLFRFVGSSNSPELFMAITLLTIITTAVLTHSAGLSAALGAFLAGLLLGETEFQHEIEINIEPFKGLLLGLFFMSVTMSIDLAEIANNPIWIVSSVIGLILLKTLIIIVLARLFGFRWHCAAEMGLLLSQGGEFAFVVIGMALGFDLLPKEIAQFMLIVVGVTMFITPFLARLARFTGTSLESRLQSEPTVQIDTVPELSGHVIIVGYGRTGQLLASILSEQTIEYVALDLDADRVAQLRNQGAPVYLGNATREAMLEKMRLRDAATLVICTDNPQASQQILSTARRMAPNLPIIVRVHDSQHAALLLAEGATQVVPEVLESGLQLAQLSLEQVGISTSAAHDLVDAKRASIDFRAR